MQTIELITNQMSWTSNTIGELYKVDGKLKYSLEKLSNLHIKPFIRTSENAVMIKIWTALITILILKALKAMAKFKWHLSNLVAFIRLNLFVKINLQQWIDKPFEENYDLPEQMYKQGGLF